MMQFIDLAEQYKRLKKDIDQSIQKVLDHGKYIMGPEVKELEDNLADYIGTKYCISCSSGTDALLMPLMAWEIGKGDAVFTTSFTFIATAEVISLLGATPIFVDIDPETYNIDAASLEGSIKKVIKEGKLKPSVIMPVDLFGLPADYGMIEKIAEKYRLKILEDAAQGFGGSYNGKKAGSFGSAAGLSFFPAKPLGCYGDGGAILTNNGELASALNSIRIHGKGSEKYDNIRIGLNSRIDTLQAAILLVKLDAFKKYELEERNRIAGIYTESFKNDMETPFIPKGYISSWAQYSVLASNSEERTALQDRLKSKGIPTAIYYKKPLHLQAAYSKLGYQKGDFIASEDISSRIFSLPMHPYLEKEAVDTIIDTISSFYSNKPE